MQLLTPEQRERIIELARNKNEKVGELRGYLNSLEMPECERCKSLEEKLVSVVRIKDHFERQFREEISYLRARCRQSLITRAWRWMSGGRHG